MSASLGKLLVVQGGGPTPVINASLFGVIAEATKSQRFNRVLGARFGNEGLLKGDFVDLSALASRELELLRISPGASLGSTRYRLGDVEIWHVAEILRAHDIRSLLVIGGNGSLCRAAVLAESVAGAGVSVIGIPKTVDNDIPGTDRCPGFASCARYVAQSVRDLGMDVRTLPQPVSIFETMGRGVGWLAAASALARVDEAHAPHLIYVPERPFEMVRFFDDLDRVVTKHGWGVAVVAEGLRDRSGRLIYEMSQTSQRDALDRPLPGGVAALLAEAASRELKIRCRFEQPGLCARSSALHASLIDRADAELVGRAAVRAAIDGDWGHLVALEPLTNLGAPPRYKLIPLSRAAGERAIPPDWLNENNTAVAPAFVDYVRPLVGDLADYAIPLRDVGRGDADDHFVG